VLVGLVEHLLAPGVAAVGYMYAVGVVLDLVGAVHWTLSLVALVGCGVTAGAVGRPAPRFVLKSYAVVGGTVGWYLLFGGGAAELAAGLGSVAADYPTAVLAVTVPFVLFGLFGPLLVVAGSPGWPERS
jgi:hypothetical protein